MKNIFLPKNKSNHYKGGNITHTQWSHQKFKKKHKGKKKKRNVIQQTTYHHKNVPDDIIPIDCLHEKSFIQTPGFSNIQKMVTPAITNWHNHINNLQPWDKELLSDIQIVNKTTLQKKLKTKENIYICSDGGPKDGIGSFGAIIANVKEIMIKFSGQAYGKASRLFRAEVYHMLAILRLLLHLIQFHNITI